MKKLKEFYGQVFNTVIGEMLLFVSLTKLVVSYNQIRESLNITVITYLTQSIEHSQKMFETPGVKSVLSNLEIFHV